MKAFVYIRFNCAACERIVTTINENDLDASIINVQEISGEQPHIQFFPSLYVDGHLKAIGDDILDFLTK